MKRSVYICEFWWTIHQIMGDETGIRELNTTWSHYHYQGGEDMERKGPTIYLKFEININSNYNFVSFSILISSFWNLSSNREACKDILVKRMLVTFWSDSYTVDRYTTQYLHATYCQATGTGTGNEDGDGKWDTKGTPSPRRWQYNLIL